MANESKHAHLQIPKINRTEKQAKFYAIMNYMFNSKVLENIEKERIERLTRIVLIENNHSIDEYEVAMEDIYM